MNGEVDTEACPSTGPSYIFYLFFFSIQPHLTHFLPTQYPTASVWSVRLSNASYDPIKDLAAREDTEGPVGTTVNVMHPNCKVNDMPPVSLAPAWLPYFFSSDIVYCSPRSSRRKSIARHISSSPPPFLPFFQANADWTLTIHFPSLLEDPFAHDRKMRLLQEAMHEGGREAAVSRETLKSLLQTPRVTSKRGWREERRGREGGEKEGEGNAKVETGVSMDSEDGMRIGR